MHFISENYTFTFTETVFMLLTEPFVMTAGTLVLIYITLLTAYDMQNRPNPSSSFKIWTVSPVLGIISGLFTSLIFALAAAYLVDLDKGHYEATGTIEKIEYHSEYAGQTDGDFTISLKLDNGDPVDIQMPLQSPESIEQGDAFTLQSETRFKGKDFTPIENLSYSSDQQSLTGKQHLGSRFVVNLIVDGDVVKGDSD